MTEFSLIELHTRVLVPFSWDLRQTPISSAIQALRDVTLKGKSLWTNSEPVGNYQAEFFDFVTGFLFPADNISLGGAYLRLDPNVHDQVFGKFIAVDYDLISRPKNPRRSVKAFCPTFPGVELFLAPSSVGVLSLSLLVRGESNPDSALDDFKLFNYAISQMGRRNIPVLRRPHPETDPHMFASGQAAPYAAQSFEALEDRLGRFGSSFSVDELTSLLLSPVFLFPGFRYVQKQSSLHTVAVLPQGVLLSDGPHVESLGPFLSGLAQVEEPLHAGTDTNLVLVENDHLNNHHWAATSSLASAHLISLQAVPFDAQRAAIVRDKYFICHLTAIIQRAAVQYMQIAAAQLMDRHPNDTHGLPLLRKDALWFSVAADWTEVSSRDAVNRYYRQCRQALRIKENMEKVSAAIRDFDAADQSRAQHDTIRALEKAQHEQHETLLAVERSQTKLEWIEILIVGIYLAEFLHIVGDLLHLSPPSLLASVVIGGLAGMGGAYWVLRPNRPDKDLGHPGRRLVAIWTALLFLAAWMIGSFLWAGAKIEAVHSRQNVLERRYRRAIEARDATPVEAAILRRIESDLEKASQETYEDHLSAADEYVEHAEHLLRELPSR